MFKRILQAVGLAQPDASKPPETGRSPQWPKVRAAHLAAHPACAACGTREHLNVHHVYPVSWPGGKVVELLESNLLTLCEGPGRSCHFTFGHAYNWRSFNPCVREDADRFLQRVRNRPCQNEQLK